MRERALSKNSRINLEITQEIENENELRALQIENANFLTKITNLESSLEAANKNVFSLQASNDDMQSLLGSLEAEVRDLRSREQSHELELEEERKLARKEAIEMIAVSWPKIERILYIITLLEKWRRQEEAQRSSGAQRKIRKEN